MYHCYVVGSSCVCKHVSLARHFLSYAIWSISKRAESPRHQMPKPVPVTKYNVWRGLRIYPLQTEKLKLQFVLVWNCMHARYCKVVSTCKIIVWHDGAQALLRHFSDVKLFVYANMSSFARNYSCPPWRRVIVHQRFPVFVYTPP